nr:Chain B, proteinsubunit pshX [Heliomicrobium modesticaldum Ice1]
YSPTFNVAHILAFFFLFLHIPFYFV